MDWPLRRLEELTEADRPITYGVVKPGPEDPDNGVKFIRGGDIFEGKLAIEKLRTITPKISQSYSRTLLRGGELIVSLVGNPGHVAVVPKTLAGANLARQTGLVALRDGIDADFVKFFLMSPPGRAELFSQTTGSVQTVINLANLKHVRVPLPPLPVQRRIAGILSAYDGLIESNLRRIRILEEMTHILYREWFVHFRFPGHKKIPSVASPLGTIPRGWEVKNLESLITNHIGGGWGKDAPDESHTKPAWVIRGTDIPDARHCQVTNVPYRYHTVSNLRSRRLQAGDIIFEVSGGSKGQPVGRALFVSKELLSAFGGDPVICASFCKRVRPDASAYCSELHYLSFLEGYESGEIEQFQVQSTGISNFKWTEYIQQTQRVVPPEPLQACFRKLVAPLFSQIATLGLKTMNLHRTRDLLLPRLLSGHVSVSKTDACINGA